MALEGLVRLEPLLAMLAAKTHVGKVLNDFQDDPVVIVGNEGLELSGWELRQEIRLLLAEPPCATRILQFDGKAAVAHVEIEDQDVRRTALISLLPGIEAFRAGVLQLAQSSGEEGMREEAANKVYHLVVQIAFVA